MSDNAAAPPDGGDHGSVTAHGRRAFLQKVGLATAVTWTVPSIVSVSAAGAATVPPLPDPLTFIAVGPDPFVWRSTDGGVSWNVATITSTSPLRSVATDGLGTWVATIGPTTAPFVKRSVDDGLTWTTPTVGPATGRGVVAVTTRSTGTMWIALRVAGGLASATSRSTDGGDTWTSGTGAPVPTTALAVGPTVSSLDPDARTWIAVGGTNVYRSTDDCATFTTNILTSDGVTRSLQGVATDGSGNWVVVNGSFNGADLLRVWISGDDGLTWTLAATQPTGTCRAVATDGLGTWVAVGGNLDNSGTAPDWWVSTDNGSTWTDNSTNTVAYVFVATDGLGHWVAIDTLIASRRAWASTDVGTTWTAGTPAFGVAIAGVAAGRMLP